MEGMVGDEEDDLLGGDDLATTSVGGKKSARISAVFAEDEEDPSVASSGGGGSSAAANPSSAAASSSSAAASSSSASSSSAAASSKAPLVVENIFKSLPTAARGAPRSPSSSFKTRKMATPPPRLVVTRTKCCLNAMEIQNLYQKVVEKLFQYGELEKSEFPRFREGGVAGTPRSSLGGASSRRSSIGGSGISGGAAASTSLLNNLLSTNDLGFYGLTREQIQTATAPYLPSAQQIEQMLSMLDETPLLRSVAAPGGAFGGGFGTSPSVFTTPTGGRGSARGLGLSGGRGRAGRASGSSFAGGLRPAMWQKRELTLDPQICCNKVKHLPMGKGSKIHTNAP